MSKINIWRLLEDGSYHFSKEQPDVNGAPEKGATPPPEEETVDSEADDDVNKADFEDEDLL